MFFALDRDGERVTATKGARGTCAHCSQDVIAKCGPRKIHHWAHSAGKNDCDPWAESDTVWHRNWQARAESAWCEVSMGEHRADIRRPQDGLVIELQHSYISREEVREREAFYGNMWWVFDTEPWRFRAWIAADGTAGYRWISRRGTLDVARRPIFLDLGGPLIRITGFGRQGCVSGVGVLVSRSEFISEVGLRPLDDKELQRTSHYSAPQKDGGVVLARSLEVLRGWESVNGMAMHHDLRGGTMEVAIPEVRPLVTAHGAGAGTRSGR